MESVPTAPLRFAVLWHHQIAEPHFDLLVETRPGSDLATWRSPVWPITGRTPVTRLKDHRRIYLHYDGQLAADRGRVDRVGDGICRVEPGNDGGLVIRFMEGAGELWLQPLGGDAWEAMP